jgi:hypothetical protein
MGDRRRLLVFIGRLVFSLLVSGMLFLLYLFLWIITFGAMFRKAWKYGLYDLWFFS